MGREDPDSAVEAADTARLVAGVQAGQTELFASIYSRYFERVYNYLRILLRDHHEAEDAAQQVFVQAFAALPRYVKTNRPFPAWLFTIVRNQALDRLRAQGKIEVQDPSEVERCQSGATADAAPITALDWISDRDLLLFVERLPLPQRQVLLLRYMLDLTIAETAAVLGRGESDVSMLQSRALSFLRRRLIAVGREPARADGNAKMRRFTKPAQVLRRRRFVLQ